MLERGGVDDRARVIHAAEAIAAAIGRKDGPAVRQMLAAGFVQRSLGGSSSDADAFIEGIAAIPGDILTIRLEQLDADLTPLGAIATGVQFAQVRIGGKVIDDRRGFIDLFVQQAGEWRLQAAVDAPAPAVDDIQIPRRP